MQLLLQRTSLRLLMLLRPCVPLQLRQQRRDLWLLRSPKRRTAWLASWLRPLAPKLQRHNVMHDWLHMLLRLLQADLPDPRLL